MTKMLVAASAAIALAGCATSGQPGLTDFNKRFGEEIPAAPQYVVDRLTDNRYQVTVYQGAAVVAERTTRVGFLQRAAFRVMEEECRQRRASLGEYQVSSQADGWGYVNLMAVFSCSQGA